MRQRRPLTRNIAISVPPEKIEFMDRRAAVLGISRSQYLCQLVRADLRIYAKELGLDSHPTPADDVSQAGWAFFCADLARWQGSADMAE